MSSKRFSRMISAAELLAVLLLILYCAFALWNFGEIKASIIYKAVENKENINKENDNKNTDSSPQAEKEKEIIPDIEGIPEKGFFIYINLDELKMYVFKDNKHIKTYPVSGGKTSTPSPEGRWVITTKDTWGEGFGGRWMGFYVPWGMYGIHGTITPWEIGKYNASEGCIRMKNDNLKELYKIIPHGTVVVIEQKNRPFRVMKNGDIGSDVLEAQKNLKTLGYYNGYPDGTFGSVFENSVRKFQKDNKIYASGIIYRNTYELIKKRILEKQQD